MPIKMTLVEGNGKILGDVSIKMEGAAMAGLILPGNPSQKPSQSQLLASIMKNPNQDDKPSDVLQPETKPNNPSPTQRELNLWEENAIQKFPDITADMFLNANSRRDQFKLYHLAALERLVNNNVPADLALQTVIPLSREEADNICKEGQSNAAEYDVRSNNSPRLK